MALQNAGRPSVSGSPQLPRGYQGADGSEDYRQPDKGQLLQGHEGVRQGYQTHHREQLCLQLTRHRLLLPDKGVSGLLRTVMGRVQEISQAICGLFQ